MKKGIYFNRTFSSNSYFWNNLFNNSHIQYETGNKASTNMNGGSHEAVAAYVSRYLSASRSATLYGNKFFDVYPSNSYVLKYSNRILGDVTEEF
jgi:hypothetical protein